MNIAYILNTTAPNSGATKAFMNMLEGVMKRGVKPYVVVPDGEGITCELKSRNIPTLVVTYRTSAYPTFHTLKEKVLFVPKLIARIIVNHRATKVLTSFLKDNKIDIVHSNTGVVRIGFDAAQKVGVPHIYHIREFANLLGYRYFPRSSSFYHQLNCNQSYSICITKAVQKHYGQENRAHYSRVIYDGVFSKMEVIPRSGTKDYFLYAGRIQQPKGLDQLLRAYKQYASKSASPLHLKVAGSNDGDLYYQQQLTFIKDNGLTEYVEILGVCDDMASLMQNARALIVSSPFEGFGFCMPEAMQQGCLVIGRNSSGTKEQLDNALEMTGQEIALRYETIEELAKLLSDVASNSLSCYDHIIQKAFEVVNQLYTKEKHAQRICQYYNDILVGDQS